MNEDIILAVGFLLIIFSIASSIFFGFYYWYSFYLIGAFVFFGTLNQKNKIKTVFTLFFENKVKKFVLIYIFGTILSFLVDVIHGRLIANLWYYPHLSGGAALILPIIIYYPFGGLQIYETFYFIKHELSKKFKNKPKFSIPTNLKGIFSYLFIVFLILGVLLPIFNFFLNENIYAKELAVVVMVLTIFSFDMINYRLNNGSIFFDLLEGNKLTLAALLLSWFLLVLLHEYPNTFSWEWIYTMPFTNIEMLKINIIVLTLGWIFLICISVSYVNLILYFLRKMK